MEFVHSEGIDTFDVGVPAKRLTLRLAEFFPSTVMKFMAAKKNDKEVGNDDHNNKWTAR